ncbi:chromate efflux transporter [Agaribacter flavus]|uniref:Chromate efflux transporter n=1 Tax=Agaribacter flavus TaxID=1902781 RepID=A0ABV7FPL0_9ALTE
MIKRLVEVFGRFLLLGLTAFGGPVAHLAYFRKTLIDKYQWLSEQQYAELVALCQFLPGPASSQVGFALGYARAGFFGALAAFIAFTAPSVCLLVVFSYGLDYVSPDLKSILIHGLKLTACIVVAEALWGMWGKLCTDLYRKLLAIAVSAILLAWSQTGLHLLVLSSAGLLSMLFVREGVITTVECQPFIHINKALSLCCLVLFAVLLAFTVFALPFVSKELQIAGGFYQAGALVFGGGHVVLPMLQELVVERAWLDEQLFLAGYGAAQSLPGPLFSFAAYLGFNIDADIAPMLLAFVALGAIFLPGFLLLIGVLPYWQSLRHYPRVAKFVTGLNAAVVGLVAAALVDPIVSVSITHWLDAFYVCIVLFAVLRYHLTPLVVIALSLSYALSTHWFGFI